MIEFYIEPFDSTSDSFYVSTSRDRNCLDRMVQNPGIKDRFYLRIMPLGDFSYFFHNIETALTTVVK